MSFLNPITALIAAGITIPLLVSLYFLKLRRKPIAVPSTLLWKKAIQDLQVNAPFQRIRNNLLLWLQLLLLILLLIAMARPTKQALVTPGQRVVIVIDRSGSMNTSDGNDSGDTRLEAAKKAALQLVDSLDAASSAGGAMVVAFAERAGVVQTFTNDRGLLRSAIRGITPTDQRGRIEPALGLVEPHTAEGGAEAGGLSVYIFSDGKVHHDGPELPALSGAEVTFMSLGKADSPNVGIVSASARRDYDQPEKVSVFARLSNAGLSSVNTNVALKVDGRAVRARAVSLPAATADGPGDAAVTFEVQLMGGAAIEVSHDATDRLPADDTARLQLLPAQRLRVLLVTAGNRYLREAIVAAGARQLELMNPEQYEAIDAAELRDGGPTVGEGFDVIVFDRYTPAQVPPVSSLSFGAAPPIPGLSVQPSSADAPAMQAVLTWQRDHPVMRYVVLDDVTLRKPGRLTVPMNAEVLAVGLAGPLIAEVTGSSLAGQGGGGRHVVVSFDVLESRWPHHWSFQVFMVNALEVLGLGSQVSAGEAAMVYRAGDTASVPAPGGLSMVSYEGPAGRLSAAVRQGRASLPAFERVGYYASNDVGVTVPYDRLPVNLLDPLETDIRPVDKLELGTSAVQATEEDTAIRKEVWPWFAWGALALLCVEWFVYTQRMRV